MPSNRPTDNAPGADHLDLDALADHLAGISDATAHLSDCAGCNARLLELRAAELMVVATLSTLPEPTMPREFADRLASALAAEPALTAPTGPREPHSLESSSREPSSNVIPLESRRPHRTWVPAVAASAVLMVGGLLGWQLLSGSGATPTNSPSGAAAGQDAGPVTANSGTNYSDPVAVKANLAGVLTGAQADMFALNAPMPPALGAPEPGAAKGVAPPDSSATGSNPADSGATALSADPLALLREPAGLASCLSTLLTPGQPEDRPVALDYASYAGEPALAVLLPDPDPAKLSVFVVGSTCSGSEPDLLFFFRIDKPS